MATIRIEKFAATNSGGIPANTMIDHDVKESECALLRNNYQYTIDINAEVARRILNLSMTQNMFCKAYNPDALWVYLKYACLSKPKYHPTLTVCTINVDGLLHQLLI
ncbi:uncharacterized protein PHALS_15411 [Plasmopara halstedii]|uniref:Uncharacterized protein n=1 Tax=Plasmopara halstedii TaxID=4781 RepID=A0A0P1AGR6_PLAHL|nr:uncharacterized protein PHALS_15411 [Plasmopara halstedii]CEG39871.1 hypothetical protein PHALS_15411 [Plasmopara halstedii]|eukprot:XP_024576240.1 hypothetical protein PHALS_15411 [Plasmopara halstedii]